jgi:purine-binding chemotaxis protein CheW
VAIRVGSRLIALAVDSVIGLRSIEADTSVGLPLLLQDAGDVVAAVGTLDAELLLVLNTARIVPQAVLDSVDAEGSSL